MGRCYFNNYLYLFRKQFGCCEGLRKKVGLYHKANAINTCKTNVNQFINIALPSYDLQIEETVRHIDFFECSQIRHVWAWVNHHD